MGEIVLLVFIGLFLVPALIFVLYAVIAQIPDMLKAINESKEAINKFKRGEK